jgi:hypothetical protein
MLKNLGYAGAYYDENIAVSILLENPLEHDLDATTLVFSVALRAKTGDMVDSRLDDFTFYIMDESNFLYNIQSMPYIKPVTEMIKDDEPIRYPTGLIYTDFEYEFLFQDLRIAFYYHPYEKICIIKLEH